MFRNPRTLKLSGYPGISASKPVFETDLWFPLQDLTQLTVVRVASTYTLGFRQIMASPNRLSRHPGHNIHECVHRHTPIRAEIKWFAEVRSHQSIDPFN